MTFPEDFKLTLHSIVPGAIQYKATKPNGTIISIIGGGMGLYGDGDTTFEMWDMDEEEPRGYMTKDQINEYLSKL